MSSFDTSQHSLNVSSSKQKYSFPKTRRFQTQHSVACDKLYSIPTTISRRATMLGYGKKSMGINNNSYIPGVGTYNYSSLMNPEKNLQHSISFGVSREKMELGGPLGNVKKFLQKLPAPGTYEAKIVRDHRAPLLRSRLPDHQFEKLKKNPGPGTYMHEELGKNNYYLNSRHQNSTNMKISKVSRLDPIDKKMFSIGPADYKTVDGLSATGRYRLAKNSSINSCVFSRSLRNGIQEKSVIANPGPGQYNAFSGFG